MMQNISRGYLHNNLGNLWEMYTICMMCMGYIYMHNLQGVCGILWMGGTIERNGYPVCIFFCIYFFHELYLLGIYYTE